MLFRAGFGVVVVVDPEDPGGVGVVDQNAAILGVGTNVLALNGGGLREYILRLLRELMAE